MNQTKDFTCNLQNGPTPDLSTLPSCVLRVTAASWVDELMAHPTGLNVIILYVAEILRLSEDAHILVELE